MSAGRMGRAVSLACVVISLSACGGARAVDGGDATVLVAERTGGGMDARLEGTLAVVDGCLGITDVTTYRDTVVVWPHGTEVTSDAPTTIELPGVGEIAVGEKVSVDGGVDRSTTGRVGGLVVPSYCDSTEIWLAR
ncbi:hypothetical protein [Nocardioides sp. zg-1228]|uniref:hypothetical protein n=1 Tax=Nocardioides sp. zg-1228 TaxID=2763008 RepID=UPI0016435EC5|nr:hypothetical protein [Nocardioides sp. zg-1228]MBC2934228.1 hypothetical protein [Nocardioides sp. zg-1228]QSF59010.1 hypothetical protein JX575_07535 [Nocardioides sp. zg-1228]